MKKIATFILMLMASSPLFAQYTLEYKGQPYFFEKNNSIQGEPFLFSDWKSGKVISVSGDIYDNVKLKYDAEKSIFLFNRNDTAYKFIEQPAKVILYDEAHGGDSTYNMVFTSEITGYDNIKANGFIQILADGKVTLLKYYQKNVEGEEKSDGYSIASRQYKLHTYLWTIVKHKVIPAKFSSGFLEVITADKNAAIKDYINSHKLNMKNERDFIAALKYYNQISQ